MDRRTRGLVPCQEMSIVEIPFRVKSKTVSILTRLPLYGIIAQLARTSEIRREVV